MQNGQGLTQRSEFFTHRLANGLQIVAERMPDVESVALGFQVVTGARDEQPHEDGVSHFLEHMVFKGTQTGLDAAQINARFHRIGASVNAGTGKETTTYYCALLNDYYDDAFVLLRDMQQPRLDADEFNMERNVILEEIARYLDNPNSLAARTLASVYYEHHPLKATILGSRESIAGMPLETMRNYWQRRYVANNTIFSVAGKFDWDHVVNLVEQGCSDWPSGGAERDLLANEPIPQFVVMTKPSLKGQLIMMMLPGPNIQNERDRFIASMLSIIIEDDRLYWNVRETGMATSVGFGSSASEDVGTFSAYASTTPEKAIETFRAIRHEMEHIATPEGRATADELERAKNKVITSLVFGGESSMNRMFSNVNDWVVRKRLRTLDERLSMLESITLEDIDDMLRRYPLTGPLVALTYGPMLPDEVAAAAPDLPLRVEQVPNS